MTTNSEHQPADTLVSNRTYNIMKQAAQLILPALGAFYYALAGIWGFPKADEVVGTIVASNTLLGVILLFLSRAYNKSDAKYDGVINITENEDGVKRASLRLDKYENPADVVAQEEVLFKVNKEG